MLVLNFHDESDELTRTKSKRNANSKIIVIKKKRGQPNEKKSITRAAFVKRKKRQPHFVETFLLPDWFVWHVYEILSAYIFSQPFDCLCHLLNALCTMPWLHTYDCAHTSQPSLSLACGMLTLLSWHDCIVRSLCHPIYLYLSRSVYWFLLGCLTMMKQQFRSMQYIKTAHMSFVKWHVRFLMLLYLLIYLKLFYSTSACINYKHSEQFQNQLS